MKWHVFHVTNDKSVLGISFLAFFFGEHRYDSGAKIGALMRGTGAHEVVVNSIVDGTHPFWATFKDALVHTPV